MDTEIKINSKETIEYLISIQQEMNNTANVISSANNRSNQSFMTLNDTINIIQQSYVSFGIMAEIVANSINNVTTAINSMISALMFAVEISNINQIALEIQRDMVDRLSDSVILYNGALDINNQLTRDNIDETINNSKETENATLGKNLLTAATIALTVASEALTIIQAISSSETRKGIVEGAKFIASLAKQTAALIAKGIAAMAAWIASNPFLAIGIGAAIAGTIALTTLAIKRATAPAMATGGVVSSPTLALVGEGRYPEAVVPLGESPQFASMKADIANAVIQGMSANNAMRSGGQKNLIIQLNIDGRQFAEATINDIVETLNNEGYGVLRADAMYR